MKYKIQSFKILDELREEYQNRKNKLNKSIKWKLVDEINILKI